MGKLAEAIIEYKRAPIDSPAERDAAEAIHSIVDSQWWKDNVGKEFKWPKKYKKWKPFGFGEEFVHVNGFIIPKYDYEETISLLRKANKTD